MKRIEAAFNDLGLTFHKTRAAGLFFRTMDTDPVSVLTPDSLTNFENLFKIIGERLQKHVDRDALPSR